MNRSVLIVTPFFAPQSHAAMFRAYKLAKYLPRFGWKPYILTVDTNYTYNEDASLLDDLPPEVEISTARYIEPTVRGARMALGGRDRTFTALKAHIRPPQEECASATPGAVTHDVGNRIYGYLREQVLQTPDAYWTWYRPALREARRLVRAHEIPLVYTTCLPYTSNRIGMALQRDGLRWVADFRDPATYSSRMSSSRDRVYLRQRRIERETLKRADAVTVLSSAYELIFRDMYGAAVRSPIHFIPTGLDEQYLPTVAAPARPYPYIVFAGEFLPEYGSSFLDVFALALSSEPLRGLGIRLLVVGRTEINRPRMLSHLTRLGIAQSVEFLDHMPQKELYSLLVGARGGVLIPGPTAHWWNNFAKMVDYIALRVPCLAMVPDPSEARSELTKARLGIFLDGNRETAARTLAEFLHGRMERPKPIPDVCDRYLATSQVRSFADLFQGVL